MARAQHGKCESNTAAMCKSKREKHNLNLFGAAWQGNGVGAAWERHGMCTHFEHGRHTGLQVFIVLFCILFAFKKIYPPQQR
jgi:hypothetical protein